jgi:aminopeptidase-like protein
MRSKYGEYDQYHTSLDNLDFISEEGLQLSLEIYLNIIHVIENNFLYKYKVLCEPQLSKRGLYSSLSERYSGLNSRDLLNILSYADGLNDFIDIRDKTRISFKRLVNLINVLIENDLIEKKRYF